MKRSIRYFFGFTIFLSVIAVSATSSQASSADLSAFLQTVKNKTDKQTWNSIDTFYESRDYQPAWYDQDNDENADIEDIAEAVQNSAYENGLEPQNYDLAGVISTYADKELSQEAFLNREWLLTKTLAQYLHDLQFGRIDPATYDSKLFMPPETFHLENQIKAALNNDIEDLLHELEPPQHEYQNLKKQLERYRKIVDNGGWKMIEYKKAPIIYPGENHEIIPQIRERLHFYDYDGDLPDKIWVDKGRIDTEKNNLDSIEAEEQQSKGIDAAFKYDEDLAEKVAEFQYFHGKKTDGAIGPNTLAALNTPAAKRIEQIKVAMERWRWFPHDMGERYILVNIAGYYAQAVEDNESVFTMPIIVGEVAHQTPEFGSVIKNVKFHPDWTAPVSIAKRYLIEKIQNDPSVIDRLGYQIIDNQNGKVVSWDRVNIENLHTIDLSRYTFRQKPGVNNALGLARFSIENDYSIFMHGTPSVSLFDKDQRTFSSGCIRVQDPLTMAKFLLKDNNISERDLEASYHVQENQTPKTEYIPLKKQVPAYLSYATAWIDQQGYIHFSDDVYGRDEKLKAVLQEQS